LKCCSWRSRFFLSTDQITGISLRPSTFLSVGKMISLRPASPLNLSDLHYSTVELASAKIPGLYLKTLVSFTFSIASGEQVFVSLFSLFSINLSSPLSTHLTTSHFPNSSSRQDAPLNRSISLRGTSKRRLAGRPEHRGMRNRYRHQRE
jgi:hypothetical protein